MNKKRVLIIVVVAVAALGLLALCSLLAVPALLTLLGPAVEETFTEVVAEPGENFLQALADENYAAAYDLCNADLQAELGSPEGLATVFSATPQLESWDYSTQTAEVQGESAVVLNGDVAFADGQSGTLEVVLMLEGGEYRVAGFTIRPEG